MRKILALSILGLLATSAVAEDFLGENEPDEPEKAAEEAGWEDDKWKSKQEHWMVVDYNWAPYQCGITYLEMAEGLYDQGFRDLHISVYPLKDGKPEFQIGHVAYTKFEGNGTVTGGIGFDGAKPRKVKFKVAESNSWNDGRLISINNFNLDILRSMVTSETMEIYVNGQDTITIPLDEMPAAYKQLAVCFERVKERAPG